MTQLFFKDPAGTGLEVNFIEESAMLPQIAGR